MTSPVLSVKDLRVNFPSEAGSVSAVRGVDFDLYPGRTLGIVGESGSGKSVTSMSIMGLLPDYAKITGSVKFDGRELLGLSDKQMSEIRGNGIGMIFQDPLASLDPRMTVGQIIAEPLVTHQPALPRSQVRDRVKAMMDRVGLLPSQINRYPHEFSGGQCQRIGIARALIVEPRLIICDEPVSALDVSIQAQVINLPMKLQTDLGLSLIFIAHDLSVMRYISDRIAVIHKGDIVELADAEELVRSDWQVSDRSNRVGIRLSGATLERGRDGELPSEGAWRGAVQVPPGGEPVLFLADHPLTGGYPVVASLASYHLDLAAQIPVDCRIQFRVVAPFFEEVHGLAEGGPA